MSTLIDSLLVELNLDSKQFDKGSEAAGRAWKNTSDTAVKSTNAMEEGGKKTANSLAALKTEVVGLFLAFAGAKSILDFTKQTIDATAAVGTLGDVTGFNKNAINAWGDAFGHFGGKAEDATKVFGKFATIIDNFQRNPNANPTGIFQRLGFRSKKDFEDPEAAMLHLADEYQKGMAQRRGSKGAQMEFKAAFSGQVKEAFGMSDANIDLLEQGRASLSRLIEQFKITDRVTDADTKAAQEFNNQLVDLQKTITGLARGPLMSFITGLKNLLTPGKYAVDDSKDSWLQKAFKGGMNATDDLVHGRWGEAAGDAGRTLRAEVGGSYNGKPSGPSGHSAPIQAQAPGHPLLAAAVAAVAAAGGRVTSGLRSHESQERIYQDMLAGRHHGPVARPGSSRHEYGQAVDVKLGGAVTRESVIRSMVSRGLTVTKVLREGSQGITHFEFMRNAAKHQAAVANARAQAPLSAKWQGALASNKVSILVNVHGDVTNPHRVGKQIADSTHHHLKKRGLAAHANTGLG